MAVNAYKPGDLALTVGGYPISGYADGEFINIEQADEGTRLVVGADGEATYVVPADFSASITITLKQDADSNRVLGAMKAAESQVAVTCNDNLGFNAFGKDAMVKQHPGSTYVGKDLSNRAWIIMVPKLVNEYPSGTTPAS